MTAKKEQQKSNVVKTEDGLEVTMNKVNLDLRCEINDKLSSMVDGKPNFSLWVWVLQKVTNLSDEEINDLSMEEITQLSVKVFETINKKKLTK
tara:strand:- start:33935 stop:34213 length:279 start_codon:yes stop_codon:yes gene_type:complete